MQTSCLTCGKLMPTGQGGRCSTCRPKRSRAPKQGAHYRTAAWRKTRARAIANAGGCCAICNTTQHLQVHHRLSVEEGGTDDQSNLLVCCRSCHPKVERADKAARGL